jgi:hypothetical protein
MRAYQHNAFRRTGAGRSAKGGRRRQAESRAAFELAQDLHVLAKAGLIELGVDGLGQVRCAPTNSTDPTTNGETD